MKNDIEGVRFTGTGAYSSKSIFLPAPNFGWISSAGYDANSYAFKPYPALQTFMLYYGWEKGWAGSAQYVSFGDLGRYAKDMVHDLMYDELNTEPHLEPMLGGVLDMVKAGVRGTHASVSKPSNAMVTVSQGTYDDKVAVDWHEVQDSDGYIVYYEYIDSLWTGSTTTTFKIGSSDFNHYDIGDDIGSSPKQHVKVHVKAYNGCGVSSSEIMDGWKGWPSTSKQINDTLLIWVKSGKDAVVEWVLSATSYASFVSGDVDIPEIIDDCDVVAIARSAFNGNDVVTGVTIPSTVTNIAAGAFGGCTNLSCVVFNGPLPDGVEQSEILSHATSVYYPRQYAQEYAQIVPATQFACYSEFVDSSGNVWESEANKYKGQVALHSGAVADGGVSEMNTTLTGIDELTFSWRTSCESPLELADGTASQRDHAEFLVDGEVVATSDGESMWKEVTVNLSGGKSHTVTWRYVKDGSGSAGEDCVWVSDIQFSSIADEETMEELLDESEYNWFYEDTETTFTEDEPFEYSPNLTPENAQCHIDVCVDLSEVDGSTLLDGNTEDAQAGIVKVSGAVGLEYAVLTSNGWTMVGNESIEASDSGEVKVSISFDYSVYPSMVKYMISGHTLTNADGVSSFVCAAQKTRIQSLVANGEGTINSWAGKYEVVNSDVQEVAVDTEVELAENLDSYSNETFRVTGGETLVIPSDKVPAGGVNRKLHIDGNSAVKFDLTGLTTIPTVMKLFNGVGNSFAIGSNMKLVVPGEGVDRVSKLFVKDGNLEARVAERPTMDDSSSGESPFNVSSDGDTSTAATLIGNAVEGFWYGLETTESLNIDFSLDYDSVKQCTSTGSMKLESSANANSDSGFYRVSVSAEEP